MKNHLILLSAFLSLFLIRCGGSDGEMVYTDSVEVRDLVETI